MSDTYAVGDVVQLKSGGELMTVEAVDDSDVSCVWMEGKKIERATLPAATLKKYTVPGLGSSLPRR
jgi:uncharacterized protein YodC (DUF2158 family)